MYGTRSLPLALICCGGAISLPGGFNIDRAQPTAYQTTVRQICLKQIYFVLQ